MVRTIDADERRRVLAEAVWEVIRRDGFEAASVRRVAAEAGLSAGSVRHFFASQAELHRFAMTELHRTVAVRVEEVLAVPDDDPVERAVAALRLLLPDADVRRSEYVAHVAFLARAAVDPGLAPVATEAYEAMDGLYRLLLDDLRARRLIAAETDLADAVRRLGVLIEGLLLRMLLTPYPGDADDATADLRGFFGRLGEPA